MGCTHLTDIGHRLFDNRTIWFLMSGPDLEASYEKNIRQACRQRVDKKKIKIALLVKSGSSGYSGRLLQGKSKAFRRRSHGPLTLCVSLHVFDQRQSLQCF